MERKLETIKLETIATVAMSSLVYGENGPKLDDFAEMYLEASNFYPSITHKTLSGVYRLQQIKELQYSATRSVKLYSHRPGIVLPEPNLPSISLKEVLFRRRTVRTYSGEQISLIDLSSLLHGSSGISGEIEYEPGLTQFIRTVPSGGALYPFEIYCVIFNVEGVTPGLYHYDPLRSKLEEVRIGDFKDLISEASMQHELVKECAATIIITGMFWRTRFKYGLRGFRFVLMEVGHVAQNLLLSAEALDMAAVLIGGYYDGQVSEFLEIDGVNEAPLYLVTLGYKSTREGGEKSRCLLSQKQDIRMIIW